ncbi:MULTISPECIES: PucR family transcriptional regulator [unclassified Pseudomonas]|uniref:PucR family transcriptional regulator n=1 Tax=unclassified Pseudomonas TaxID=196821 RepID=UPI0021C85A28|nr:MULTISPECIES: PucR family transcriptional regulator [unclassified Pseudomonas]MCU1735110.1 PucR family transcriptional regulator ligand-binding domain-containing protein [Pseudomonas sp. 20P_3.2_Bac4]MCU1743585.1 PucR family transcriptional regulator ligand-binding domain-containing protein [Pseudomonas sp. 20P_3.2_Bac5]
MKLDVAIEHTVLREATVVAGAGAMDREITWVHIVDHPEITNWLKPGELLLTTGYNWPEADEDSRDMVRRLSEIGLAGVVLAVPHFREHFTQAAIDEANRCNLPLLELPWEIQFSEIMHDVLARIINIQAETIRRSDLIHRTLTEAALEMNNLEGLARALHAALDKAATVVSIDGTLLGSSDPQAREEYEREVIRDLTAHNSLAELFKDNAPVVLPGGARLGASRLGGAIKLRGEIAAVVWLEGETDQFGELDTRALEHSVVIAALHLAYQRQLSDQETRLGHAFVAGLLEGKFSATPSAIERARASGWSESRSYRVCLVLVNEPIPLSIEGFNRRAKLADRIASAMQTFSVAPLISVSLNQISFLLPAEVAPESVWKTIRTEGSALAVSRVHRGVDGMALGSEDVAALLPLLRPGKLHDFDEVLFPRALMGDADARRLLLERMIVPLEHPKRGNSLTDTALCLAREGFQLLNTAKALDIHISTLRYRVERIESLLGISLDNPEDRFKLQVAAQMHRLVSEEF